MRLPLSLVVVLLVAFALSGCAMTSASASVDSERLQAADAPLESVMIVTRFVNSGGPFEGLLATELSAALRERGIDTFVRIEPDAQPEFSVEQARKFGLTAVLRYAFGTTQIMSTGPTVQAVPRSTSNAALMLQETETGRAVWRAQVSSSATSTDMIRVAKVEANEIIRALERDGLIPRLGG